MRVIHLLPIGIYFFLLIVSLNWRLKFALTYPVLWRVSEKKINAESEKRRSRAAPHAGCTRHNPTCQFNRFLNSLRESQSLICRTETSGWKCSFPWLSDPTEETFGRLAMGYYKCDVYYARTVQIMPCRLWRVVLMVNSYDDNGLNPVQFQWVCIWRCSFFLPQPLWWEVNIFPSAAFSGSRESVLLLTFCRRGWGDPLWLWMYVMKECNWS